jgi:hypothetical protein
MNALITPADATAAEIAALEADYYALQAEVERLRSASDTAWEKYQAVHVTYELMLAAGHDPLCAAVREVGALEIDMIEAWKAAHAPFRAALDAAAPVAGILAAIETARYEAKLAVLRGE